MKQEWMRTRRLPDMARVATALVLPALALLPARPAQATYTSTVSGTVANMIGSSASDTLSFTVSGGLLRHNRFAAGDPGFASDNLADTLD